jgi:hypothetical protein
MSSSRPERTGGIGRSVTFADVLRYQSRSFRGRPARSAHGEIQLGGIVFHVRRTLAADTTDDPYQSLEMSDEEATFLPVGAPVYEVTGYPPSQRLAAYRMDRQERLYIYDVKEE